MITLKKILFPLFSLFLLYRSIMLLKQLMVANPQDYSRTETFIISFLLTLFITGIFAITGFAYPTSSLLPANYYKVKNPVKTNQLYNALGVKYFKVLLLIFFWSSKRNRTKYFDGTRNGMQNFIYQTKQSEFGHLGAFVVIFIVSIVLILHHYYLLVAIATVINIIANLYPIILQRHHRYRILKIRGDYSKSIP